MNRESLNKNVEALNSQRTHWQTTFEHKAEMFGIEPSYAACQAAEVFQLEGKRRILELGSGQGRDTLFFLQSGFEVYAMDYSAPGLQAIQRKAERLGLASALKTVCHDVRQPLPFAADTFDGCFSHMLYCMALATAELEFLSDEIRRVMKPRGLNFYTARNTNDPDYRTGTHRSENMYELDGGFIVHFFGREKVQCLANGYEMESVVEFEEGALPKRPFLVTLRKPDTRLPSPKSPSP